MIAFFQKQKNVFSLGELIGELKMDTRTVKDWLSLYQVFSQGPALRKIKVNDHVVYEVIHKEEKKEITKGKVTLGPKEGLRRSKIQKGVAFVTFLHQQEQAFFRSTMERVLGMKPDQSKNWIELYQVFNNGPEVMEEKVEKDLIAYRIR